MPSIWLLCPIFRSYETMDNSRKIDGVSPFYLVIKGSEATKHSMLPATTSNLSSHHWLLHSKILSYRNCLLGYKVRKWLLTKERYAGCSRECTWALFSS